MLAGAGTMPRSLPLRIGTGLAVASVATLLVITIWLNDRGRAPAGHPNPDVVQVGLVEGETVPGYLAAAGSELSTMVRTEPGAPIWALVSLDAYRSATDLTRMLDGVAVAQVYLRAPQAGPMTQVVRIPVYRMPDDVVAGMLSAAVGRDRERAGYEHLSDEVAGSDVGQARLRSAYETAARTAADEANAYRRGCSCVFAAVVRATPPTLAGIARHDGVRTVDPAPEVRALDRTQFRPPLPEDRQTATTPAPSASLPIAPGTRTPVPSSTGANVTSPSLFSAPASEESASAPAQSRDPEVPTATAGASGR
jgi:hypothetical protein